MHRNHPLVSLSLVCGILSALGPQIVLAQYASSLEVYGGLAISTTAINRATAERKGTVSRSFGIQSSVEPRLFDAVGLPVVVGWEYLGPICFDLDGSSECSFRKQDRLSVLFVSAGIAMHGPPVQFGAGVQKPTARPFVIVGREWVSAVIRLEECLNCTSSGIDFDGGLYAEPGIEISVDDDKSVAIGYRFYEGGADLENRLLVRISTSLRH